MEIMIFFAKKYWELGELKNLSFFELAILNLFFQETFFFASFQRKSVDNSGPSQFLAKQLTLSQPGGQIIPSTVLQAPPEFQTLRRAWRYNIFEKTSNSFFAHENIE